MEKFAKWDDPANLVNPFAPFTIFPPASIYITGTILLILRLPFIVVTTILLLVVTALTSIPLGPFTRLLRYLFEGPLARFLLLLLGYWSVNTEYAAASKLRLRTSKDPKKTRPYPVGSCVQSGDIVVCTATSPIEILWLTWMFRPTFAHVVDTSSEGANAAEQTAAVQSKGLWSSLFAFTSDKSVPKKSSTTSTVALKELADKRKGMGGSPVCTFPEGVCSNGRGILMFHPIFNNITFEEHRCHLLTFQHVQNSTTKFSATLPIGSGMKCFLWHCMHWNHTMNVSIFPAQELVPPPAFESEAALKANKAAQVKDRLAAKAAIAPSIAMPDAGVLGNRCRNLLAKMYGVDTFTRCSHDYDSFIKFWNNDKKNK